MEEEEEIPISIESTVINTITFLLNKLTDINLMHGRQEDSMCFVHNDRKIETRMTSTHNILTFMVPVFATKYLSMSLFTYHIFPEMESFVVFLKKERFHATAFNRFMVTNVHVKSPSQLIISYMYDAQPMTSLPGDENSGFYKNIQCYENEIGLICTSCIETPRINETENK